jgi:hypothetical protein
MPALIGKTDGVNPVYGTGFISKLKNKIEKAAEI